jgi:hypothetical protein
MNTTNQAETGNKLTHEVRTSWDVIPCHLVDMYQSVPGIFYLYLHSSTLKMEAAVSSATLVIIY